MNGTVISDTSARVVWKPSDSNVDEYVVNVVGDNGVSFKITVPGNDTSATLIGLTERTNYNVTVFAVQNGLQSTSSPIFSLLTLPDGMFNVFFEKYT